MEIRSSIARISQGLEDSGVAPSTAANRGAILPASETWQVDGGVRYGLTSNLKLIAGKESGHFESEEDFCKWLSGNWLESAVLSALQNCPEDLHLKECCMNLHLTPGKDREKRDRVEFEFDVVARRGYQLFAFSCTTESGTGKGETGLLKQKLFEVYIRARQMGGEEACAALVCCLEPNEVDKLEREVRHDIGPEVRIRVFGRDQLANLSQNLFGTPHAAASGKG